MSRVVAMGEIMARVATPGFRRFQQAMPGEVQITFAGAEASIAASLAYLGADASFVTALPQHAIADACVANLRSLGVDTRQILRTPQGRLGLYFLEQGVNQRGGNVIYDRDGSAMAITPPDAYDWEAIFAGCEWFVLSGITPAISRNGAEVARRALQEARARGAKVVFDTNYRSKLWQWDATRSPRDLAMDTFRSLLEEVEVLVGGPSEAAAILNVPTPSGDAEALRGFGAQVFQRYPRLTHLAMTLRDGSTSAVQCFGGALFEAASQELAFAPLAAAGPYEPYRIGYVVDRLGAGDAFTAGLIFSFLDPELREPRRAIAFATAAGCLAHSIEGDFHYSTRAEIEGLMQGDGGGRVSR